MRMVAASLALALLVTAEASVSWRRPAVFVRIDMQALERYVNVADVIREIRELWKPYADIDFAGIAAPVEPGYDDGLRLVIDESAQSTATTASSLAWIMFTAPGQPADLVTVSISAARNLMNEGRWKDRQMAQLPKVQQQQFMTRALARSAAHEIGHYLLRSKAHARTGLMRDHLTVADIMGNDLRVFQLEPPQIDALRRRATVPGLVVNGDMRPTGTE
jgi:hypothetical protein